MCVFYIARVFEQVFNRRHGALQMFPNNDVNMNTAYVTITYDPLRVMRL